MPTKSVDPDGARGWRAILNLSGIEAVARNGYFTAIALLSLVLTDPVARGGFGWASDDALRFVGIYLGVLFISPLVGGVIVDRYLGATRSLAVGAITITVALLELGLSHGMSQIKVLPVEVGLSERLYAGLFLLAVGNALYMPGLSALVGYLSRANASLRDAGYATLYAAMSAGAFSNGILVGWIGQRYGWSCAFIIAAISAAAATAAIFTSRRLLRFSETTVIESSKQPNAESVTDMWGGSLFGIAVVLLIAVAFVIPNYQMLGSIMLFASSNVDRVIGGFVVPPSWFIALNPLLLMIVLPVLASLQRRRDPKAHTWPNPTRLAVGFGLMSAAFTVMTGAASHQDQKALTSPWWLAIACTLLTVGELLIGPLTYALMSRFAPPGRQGVAMGALCAGFGVGASLSGMIGAMTVNEPALRIFSAIAAGCAIIACMLRWNQLRLLRRGF